MTNEQLAIFLQQVHKHLVNLADDLDDALGTAVPRHRVYSKKPEYFDNVFALPTLNPEMYETVNGRAVCLDPLTEYLDELYNQIEVLDGSKVVQRERTRHAPQR